jgi:membrane protease subunit HflK
MLQEPCNRISPRNPFPGQLSDTSIPARREDFAFQESEEDIMVQKGGGGGPFDFDPSRVPQMPKINLPNVSPRVIRALLLVGVALVLLLTSFYQIEPEEVGVIRRFGAYVRTTEPGLHLKWPFIESLVKVPVQRQLKQEFGFRTLQAGVRTQYREGDFLGESLMLTGDLNVGVVEWIVQFKIEDPRAYLFHVRDVVSTFRDMSEATMRRVVGDHSVDEVLTIGRAQIAAQAKDLLQDLCGRYGIGISVQQLVLQDVNPPDQVKPSFNEVNEAIQEKERVINEAWSDYNQAIPKAKGVALQTIQGSEGYAAERVNRAQGEAAEAIYQEYRKAPRVTRNRMYLETMSDILPRMGKTVILDEEQRGLIPLLNLATEVQK